MKIPYAAAGDAGFLMCFAAYGVLDRFAWLDKSGEARPHGRHEPWRTAEQTVLAVDRQHDRHRVGAREMFGLAFRAVAPPASLRRLRRLAAICTEAVARLPVQQRLCLSDRRQVLG